MHQAIDSELDKVIRKAASAAHGPALKLAAIAALLCVLVATRLPTVSYLENLLFALVALALVALVTSGYIRNRHLRDEDLAQLASTRFNATPEGQHLQGVYTARGYLTVENLEAAQKAYQEKHAMELEHLHVQTYVQTEAIN